MAAKTKEEIRGGDDLDLFASRETLLLCAGQGGGKSLSVVKTIELGMDADFNCVVIDFDGGIRKEVKDQIGYQPDNLEYFKASEWSRVKDGMEYAMANLGPRDWLFFEMMNSMWELSQDTYVENVYGGDIGEYLMELRSKTEREIEASGAKDPAKARRDGMKGAGLDGQTDWFPIKRMHNKDVREKALMRGNFHLCGTTALTQIDSRDADKWTEFSNLGRRPEGEKSNVYKFDTILVSYLKGKDFMWRTDLGAGKGKDRGESRKLVKDINCSGTGAIISYFDYHELEF